MKTPFQIPSLKHLWFLLLVLISMCASVFYVAGRTILWLQAPVSVFDKGIALFLLLAEAFIVTHAFGYFLNIFHVLKGRKRAVAALDDPPILTTSPIVSIVVPSYNEPISVLSNTLTCLRNLTYPNKQIFLLDDTRYDKPETSAMDLNEYRAAVDALCEELGINLFRRVWRGAKAGIINDYLRWNRNDAPVGSSMELYQEPRVPGQAKYIIVFDAEQNPLPDFVEPLLAIAEADPTLAFVQTPQYYTNFQSNRVARAAGLMQIFFYEYICEGKSEKNAMFCCGSNVLFREEPLWNVGGLDETSLTEDFATSIKLHLAGWNSLYYPRVCAFGLGPVDLKSFFTQQFRWARGTLGLLPMILRAFLRDPLRLPLSKWWEYFLSGTHYLLGIVFLITALCPVVFIFTDQPIYFTSVDFYLFFYWPYTVMAAASFIWTLRDRRYGIKDILSGLLLIQVTFPVYIKAALATLFGVRSSFRVTGKVDAKRLPLIKLWPQILLCVACGSGAVWGINRMMFEEEPYWALLGNVFWCTYFFVVTSFVFYCNKPEG